MCKHIVASFLGVMAWRPAEGAESAVVPWSPTKGGVTAAKAAAATVGAVAVRAWQAATGEAGALRAEVGVLGDALSQARERITELEAGVAARPWWPLPHVLWSQGGSRPVQRGKSGRERSKRRSAPCGLPPSPSTSRMSSTPAWMQGAAGWR